MYVCANRHVVGVEAERVVADGMIATVHVSRRSATSPHPSQRTSGGSKMGPLLRTARNGIVGVQSAVIQAIKPKRARSERKEHDECVW